MVNTSSLARYSRLAAVARLLDERPARHSSARLSGSIAKREEQDDTWQSAPYIYLQCVNRAGAAGMDVTRLANANCAEINLEGGAAAYTFDFGGTLQRDTHARIATGLSSVELRIPLATAAKIVAESMLGTFEASSDFKRQDGAFWSEAALTGGTPLLTIQTNVALGALRLVMT